MLTDTVIKEIRRMIGDTSADAVVVASDIASIVLGDVNGSSGDISFSIYSDLLSGIGFCVVPSSSYISANNNDMIGLLRDRLNDKYEDAYHWEDSQLTAFINAALDKIKGDRFDVGLIGDVPAALKEAVLSFSTYLALMGESETEENIAKATTALKVYDGSIVASTIFVNSSYANNVSGLVSDAETQIAARRSDVSSSANVPVEFKEAVRCFVCAGLLAGMEQFDEKARTRRNDYIARFEAEVAKVKRFAASSDVTSAVNEGIKEIIALRGDVSSASDVTGRFSTAIQLFAKAKLCDLTTDTGKAEYSLLMTQFNNALAVIPYHWSDATITGYITLGVSDIKKYRPDTKVQTAYATGEVALPDYMHDAIVFFCVSRCFMERTPNDKYNSERGAYYNALYKREVFGINAKI